MSDTNAPIDEIHASSLEARAWIREQIRTAHMRVAQWDVSPIPTFTETDVTSPILQPEGKTHGSSRSRWRRARA